MITIQKFGGMRPSLADDKLPVEYAVEAHNVLARDGTLRSYGVGNVISTHNFPILTLAGVSDGGDEAGVLAFDKFVSVTEGPRDFCGVRDQVLVWFNGKDTPPIRKNRFTGEEYPLLVPKPERSLRVDKVGQTGNVATEPDQRSYTYTWVDQFGVESLPAAPSRQRVSFDGEHYRLRRFEEPPPNAVAVRIYRLAAQPEEHALRGKPTEGSFQLVEQVDLTGWTGEYTDRVRHRSMEMGTLMTHEELPPPETMEQVIYLDNGYWVGFSANELYVSERHEPWNWPLRNRSTLPDRIVGIAEFNDVVYIGTTGRPWRTRVQFQARGDTADTLIDPVPYDENYPCWGQTAMVGTNFGALYTTRVGLVALTPTTATLISRPRIDESRWLEWVPNVATWHNGKYVGARAPEGKGIIFDIRDNAEGGIDLGDFVTVDLPTQVVHSGRDGRLYWADGNTLRTWDEGPQDMEYLWRSRIFRMPAPVALGAVKIEGFFGAPIKFTLYGPHGTVYTRLVRSSEPFRLPALRRLSEIQVQVEGSTQLSSIRLAQAISDLGG